MLCKFIFLFLTLVNLNLFAKETGPANSLETLSYECIKSLDPEDLEPSKIYRLSLSHPIDATSGIVIIKSMDGGFSNFPIYIEQNGRLMTENRVEEKLFGFNGGYAEKFEVLLAATKDNGDTKPLAKCVITPFPHMVQDDQGRKIELKAEDHMGYSFTIHGSGFHPNEKITVKSCSHNESASFPLDVDNQGNFVFGYNPAVVGKTEGSFKLTFSGKNIKPLKLQHYWGKIAFDGPNKYKKLKEKYPFPE